MTLTVYTEALREPENFIVIERHITILTSIHLSVGLPFVRVVSVCLPVYSIGHLYCSRLVN